MASLNYNHLRYFWAVAHEGNLTRAAEKLNVSQSALSTQIRTLEGHLGHALFDRAGRGLTLTEAGRIALDHADAIFAAGEELVQTLSGAGAARAVLRVGALATLSRNFQIGFLRPLLGDPEVELVLRSGAEGELLRALEAHRLDLVLTTRPPPRDAATPWVVHALAEQPVSLVGAPARVGAGRDLRALLAAEPLIVPTVESGVRTGLDALTHRLGVQPLIAAEVDDMALLRLLVREDAGLAVAPPIVVREELASGRLVEAARLPGLSEAFHAVSQVRRFPNPLIRRLLDAAAHKH